MKEKKITAKELDETFDEGEEDILQYADLSNITKRVNVDFPSWVVKKLDEEAKRVGGSRQALIRQIVVGYIDSRIEFELEKAKIEAKLKAG
jgi:hypothetical protein